MTYKIEATQRFQN